MREISLTRGMVALVDDEDYERISAFKWYAKICGFKVYGSRSEGDKKYYLHRELLSPALGLQVDHIDGNGLNNQRSNLRLATKAQNMANRGKQLNNTTGLKGVVRHRDKYMAHIKHQRHTIYLGVFWNKEDAARAYLEAAKKYHGDFARAE